MEKSLLDLVCPQSIQRSFKLVSIGEKEHIIELLFEEDKELVPAALSDKSVVLDGFCNSLSLLSFPIKAKPTFLVLKRRRWKIQGGDNTHYSNEYDFAQDGTKATKEFAAFLKEVHGHTPDQYLRLCGTYGD